MDPFDPDGRTLVIPARADPERDAVAQAWFARGGAVLRLDRFWAPPPVARPVLYGPDTFALVVAECLDVTLRAPPDDLLLRVPAPWRGRRIEAVSLADALKGTFPTFVKPLVIKQFRGAVWPDREALQHETRGLPPDTGVLRSEVVRFTAEVRAFVAGGTVCAAATYEGEADARAAHELFDAILARFPELPACVLDAGCLDDGRWVLLEANAAWGAGLNGCDADGALPSIAAATAPVGPGVDDGRAAGNVVRR
ncbi:MAG: ATP-grasp domain-containing protein [Polyangiales bacterium]